MKPFLTLFFIVTSAMFCAFQVWAQDDFMAYHPELTWKTIETEHFRVHYHEGTVRTANLVAKIAEDVYPHITGLYGYEPSGKVDLIIRDTEDFSNGAAYFFDNKIVFWAENLDYVLRGTHHWLRDVVTHEFTHIVSLQKALKFGRRVPAGWAQGFGYEAERRPDVVRGFPNILVSYPISGVVIPVWFAEGVAQYQSPTARFDYRDSHREMILRDRVMTDRLLDLDEMGTFGKNSIGNESAYNQGFAFVKYLGETFGDTVLAKIAHQAGSPFTLSFKGVLEKVTGVDAEALFRRWQAHLKETYTARLSTIQEHLQIGEPFAEKGIGNLYPTLSPDGRRLAYLTTGEADYLSQNQLVVADLETGKKRVLASRIAGSLTWSPDGRYLAYARLTEEPKTRSLYNDLYVYDLQADKEHRLTRSLRARNPDWSHDGKRLTFVVGSDGLTNLFVLELGDPETLFEKANWKTGYYDLENHLLRVEGETVLAGSNGRESAPETTAPARRVQFRGERIYQLTHFVDGRQIFHPRWSPDDARIVFDTSVEFGRDIAAIPAGGGKMQFILNRRCDERYPVFHPRTGELYFASDETGIFNIYRLDRQTGERQPLTNVIGGAFMPAVTPEGDLFYAHYTHQGYKIYHLKQPRPLAAEQVQYWPDYERHIPDIAAEGEVTEPLPAKPYRQTFPGASIMPRVMLDYGTLKLGSYLYTGEILDRMFFFGGFDFNFRKDYDLFTIFEFKFGKHTLFIEGYNQVQNITDQLLIPAYNIRLPIDVNFNLIEADVGLQGRFLPGILGKIFQARLAYIFSLYRARLKIPPFRAGGQLFDATAIRYTYLRGHQISLFLRHSSVPLSVDRDINPGSGRYVTVKIAREWNQFLNDFATDRAIGIEEFLPHNFNRFELNWEEYFTLPYAKRHTLTLRFQGGLLEPLRIRRGGSDFLVRDTTEVDSFFHFFAGGLPGLKGYPFYSVEGTRMVIFSATYRFPLLRQINKQILHLYLDKLFLGGFVQYGNAWRGDVNLDDFLSDVGIQLRLDTFSWYLFPTRIFFEAAYPLQEHRNGDLVYPREWRFYFGVLFDFDLRLEHRRYR